MLEYDIFYSLASVEIKKQLFREAAKKVLPPPFELSGKRAFLSLKIASPANILPFKNPSAPKFRAPLFLRGHN